MRVLLAEDDSDMLDVTTYALQKYGHEVVVATDGPSALRRWETDRPDLVLLDVNLPHKSGFEVCRAIRAQSSTPIIILTAHRDESHVVEGFECGADDYLSKPVSYRELSMRMRAVMQRHTGIPLVETTQVAEVDDIRVDLQAYEVRKANVVEHLTRLETRILYFLVANAGRVVSTERLIEFAWNYDGGDSFALKTHISHIRGKLRLEKGHPDYISAFPSIGYRLEAA
jgi:two-component system, OmpR family, response regulator RegX3